MYVDIDCMYNGYYVAYNWIKEVHIVTMLICMYFMLKYTYYHTTSDSSVFVIHFLELEISNTLIKK